MIRALFRVEWRKAPTTTRFVKYGGTLTLVWGVVFGLIDSDLLTVWNWLYALLVGAAFVGSMLALRELDRWARRRPR